MPRQLSISTITTPNSTAVPMVKYKDFQRPTNIKQKRKKTHLLHEDSEDSAKLRLCSGLQLTRHHFKWTTWCKWQVLYHNIIIITWNTGNDCRQTVMTHSNYTNNECYDNLKKWSYIVVWNTNGNPKRNYTET